ncbi:MAG TPA: hypothetical protein VGS19_22415 [Streptosporangiaceae bacterium]|nr:hypothetical protein [Streptosporangiaceae bacterium]
MVDVTGHDVTWNSLSGASTTTLADPEGGGLTGVSCTAALGCVATDFDGAAVALP